MWRSVMYVRRLFATLATPQRYSITSKPQGETVFWSCRGEEGKSQEISKYILHSEINILVKVITSSILYCVQIIVVIQIDIEYKNFFV